MFFKSSKGHVSLICDIGSASVGVAVVDFSFAKPSILFSSRLPITIQEKFDHDKLKERVLSFLDEEIAEVEKSQKFGGLHNTTGRFISTAHIFFASPWYKSKSAFTSTKKDKQFIIDKRSLEELIDGEENKFKQEIIAEKENKIFGDMQIVEREMLRIRLNGYATANPFLKKATEIDFMLKLSAVSKDMLVAIESKIIRRLHVKDITTHSFPIAAFFALRELAPHDSEYVFLDITGEMTDIAVIKGGAIETIGSHYFGRNNFIRKLSSTLQTPVEITLSYISLIKKGGLEESLNEQIKTSQSEILSVWREETIKKITDMTVKEGVPPRVFVTADDDVASLFLESLSSKEKEENGVFYLTDKMTDQAVIYQKHTNHDPFIALEAISIAERFK